MNEPFRLLILALSPESKPFSQWMAKLRKEWPKAETGFVNQPISLFQKLTEARHHPDQLLVHSIGNAATYLAAFCLPRSVPLIGSGIAESEFPWNRWLQNRLTAVLSPAGTKERPDRPQRNEYPIWCFGDWTSISGIREVLWSFTMIRLAGWNCRLHLFGKGCWQSTLREFSDLASTGSEIEFHDCLPDSFSNLYKPAFIFCPQINNIPDWLNPVVSQIPILCSGKSVANSEKSKGKEHLVSIAWKPAKLAKKAMDILSERHSAGDTFRVPVQLDPGWNEADCYKEIWRAKGLVAA